jgi:biotin synthase
MIDLASLAAAVLKGEQVSAAEANELWSADLDALLFQANRIRRHFKGNRIHLCSIINAKSGRCTENCRFCAQSAHHAANAAEYPLVKGSRIENAADEAARNGAACFGIVTSGRALSADEVENICAAAAKRKNIRVAASLGELDEKSLRRLKQSGITRFHHNIETAESFFPNVCTSHRFGDRIATIKRAKNAGLEICSGGIFGLGETPAQRVEFGMTLRSLDVDSIPMNFLNPIPGTPLEHAPRLSPREILRTIAVFRFLLPAKDISVCGGREINLHDIQSWIFYAGASGMMIGGYLTTAGRSVEQDLQMIRDLGLEI